MAFNFPPDHESPSKKKRAEQKRKIDARKKHETDLEADSKERQQRVRDKYSEREIARKAANEARNNRMKRLREPKKLTDRERHSSRVETRAKADLKEFTDRIKRLRSAGERQSDSAKPNSGRPTRGGPDKNSAIAADKIDRERQRIRRMTEPRAKQIEHNSKVEQKLKHQKGTPTSKPRSTGGRGGYYLIDKQLGRFVGRRKPNH